MSAMLAEKQSLLGKTPESGRRSWKLWVRLRHHFVKRALEPFFDRRMQGVPALPARAAAGTLQRPDLTKSPRFWLRRVVANIPARA
jgi:hypothetical protein